MRNCGCRSVRKHRDSNDSDKYIILNISLKFEILEKMRSTSSEPKDNLGILGKGFITSLDLKSKKSPNKYKKERRAIGNSSMKNLSKNIREFEKFT